MLIIILFVLLLRKRERKLQIRKHSHFNLPDIKALQNSRYGLRKISLLTLQNLQSTCFRSIDLAVDEFYEQKNRADEHYYRTFANTPISYHRPLFRSP